MAAQGRVDPISSHRDPCAPQPSAARPLKTHPDPVRDSAAYPHTALNRVQYAEESFPNTVATATEDQSAVAPQTAGPSNTVKDKTLKELMADFPKTFDGECHPMKGPPCHFRLVEGATPLAIRGSRPVAEPLLPRLKEEITTLEKQRIIRKVTEPTAWVHPIVVVPNKDKGIRLCVELGALNKCVVRPRFESHTP